MGVFERIKIRKRHTFHPDREKLGNSFVMPQLEQADIQSFINRFNSSTPQVKEGKQRKSEREKNAEIFQNMPKFSAVITERMVQDIRNDYESKLMEKDSQIRSLEQKIAQVAALVGDTPTGGGGAPGGFVSSGVTLWKQKLGNSVAGRLLNFFAENPGRDFNREQACLAVGVSAGAGHTNNEWGRLLRTKAVVKNGSLYKLNPNL